MSRRPLTCVVLMTLVVMLAIATGASATFPGANGRIAFEHNGSIYTVNPDGSALQRITTGQSDTTPEWSPDGRSIAFARDMNGQDPLGLSIWIANADGTGAHPVTAPDDKSDSLRPRFTPDGQTIVFQNCLGEGCDGGIFAVRTDGSGLRQITPNSGESYNWPVPSPDGQRIAFMRWHVGGVMMRIYLISFDGGGQKPITPVALEGWAPDWAPDGRFIIFSSNNYGNRPHGAIYRVRPDGHHLRRLTKPRFPFSDSMASYSPDGRRIVLVSNRRSPALRHTDLFIMRAGGTGLHRVPLPFRDVSEPRFGPQPR
jgi:Tol biopolymer transport system component